MKRQFRHFSTVCHFNWEPLNRVDRHFFFNRLEPSTLQGYLSEALFYADLPQTGSAEKQAVFGVQKSLPGIFAEPVFVSDQPEECMGTDLLRGLILALFAVLFYFELINFYMILAMQMLLSVNAAFFDPAIPSVIPQIVDEKDLRPPIQNTSL